ncbi:class I SAM-dependent methyltransferase [Flocculibacter collagenilyticus]|uniref:class I SAM-dependent methyltransferase n=1 Tax=Flocculibacter collagenilyticus TaxID=2744479 RepID=UPI0018F6B78B|nr:class I SAM-dependent methyltransferase [Flocculibacter collagenilyticus]
MPLKIRTAFPELQTQAALIIKKWGLDELEVGPFELYLGEQGLQLLKTDEPKLGPVYVDFVTGAAAHRRKYGGGKGQAIAKAVGLNKGVTPSILDGTAGLGRDAFVFASLGCKVTMIERNPIVAALLDDGLNRAYMDAEIGEWMQQNMTLISASSIELLQEIHEQPDVVYLDPMYPHPEKANKKSAVKSALIKKEMRVFQSLVGSDLDADALLAPALKLAKKRVVVKRPDYADWLDNQKPTMAIETKKNRFDVYVNAAMTD